MRKIKRMIRSLVLPTTLFEDLGFDYYGPIDGHDIKKLITALEHAKKSKKSVFIHLLTKKGKGYAEAEANPEEFHGISANGAVAKKDFSAAFGEKLVLMAEENDRIVAVTGAMPLGTGLDGFREKFPERFFDVGIAEQHAVTMSAGMAMTGLIPVVPLYSSFLQRAYDQLLHDVALQNLHIVFPIDRAGVVGADGETHQGMYDISFLYAMPNMTILSPSCYEELSQMLDYAVKEHNAPIAIRYPRGCEICENPVPKFRIGKGYILQDGDDVAIFTSGRMIKTATDTAKQLEGKVSVGVYVMPTLKPLDKDFITENAQGKKLAITIEDGVCYGGFGSNVAQSVADRCDLPPFIVKAFPDKPITHGSVAELDKLFGMDSETIASFIKERIDEREGKA